MTFKKLGIQIIGDIATGTKASQAVPAITNTLATGLSVAKSTTDSGTMQMLIMSIEPPAPCTTCDWDYGVTIREKVRFPGVHSNRSNVETKSYGDTMASVGTSAGYVTDAYQLLAETDIIKQVAADIGLHVAEQRYPMKQTGSAVEARRMYKCTRTDNLNEIDFFDEDGVQIGASVVTGASGKLAAEAINNAASVRDAVIAFPCGQTTSFYVMSRVNGGIFTVTDGGGTGILTVNERYIVFLSKDDDVQFDVITEKALGATFSKASLFVLGSTTTAGTTTVLVDGTTTAAVNDHTTTTTYSTNINTGFTNASITDAWACGDVNRDKVYIWGGSTAQTFVFNFSATSTTVLDYKYSGYPTFAQLTPEDVFRMFWNNMDGGNIAAMQYGDQPLKDTQYNVYRIKSENLKITSLHGAGYNQTGEVEYEIYVPKTVAVTNYWDADASTVWSYMVAPITADTTFEGLLGIVTGLAVTSW